MKIPRRWGGSVTVANNAGRKGDHILAMGDGRPYGVHHGLDLPNHKLRTVLWDWIGQALSAEELAGIDRILSGLEGELSRHLDKLLTPRGICLASQRCARLRLSGLFPTPSAAT